MMAIILWAHRQRLSESQTHKAPAAAVGCCRGTAASNTHSTRRGQALPPPCAAQGQRLQIIPSTQGNPTQSGQLRSLPCRPLGKGRPHPWGLKAAAAAAPARHWCAVRRPTQLPYLTRSKGRSARTNARPKASTLRRSCCFGFDQASAGLASAICGRPQLRQQVPPYRGSVFAVSRLPVPKALRPPLHLSKRNAASVGQPPRLRDSVRPLCVKMPQLPPVGRVSADGAARIG